MSEYKFLNNRKGICVMMFSKRIIYKSDVCTFLSKVAKRIRAENIELEYMEEETTKRRKRRWKRRYISGKYEKLMVAIAHRGT